MNCPHCHEENLIGAKICVACGRNMMSLPAFRQSASATNSQIPWSQRATETNLPADLGFRPGEDAPDPHDSPPIPPPDEGPPPERAQSLPIQALCRVCLEGFDKKPEDVGVMICPSCRNIAPKGGGDAGQNEVRFHPSTQEQPDVDPRTGGAIPRMKPVAKRAGLRTGPVVAVVGLVLGLVGIAVVSIARREKDPASEFLIDVKADDATLTVTPPESDVTRLEMTLNLSLTHELMRASFSSKLDPILDLQQKSVQIADVAWVRDDSRGTVLDAAVEYRVAMQTGVAPGIDGREARVNPWDSHRGTQRLIVPFGSPTELLGGGTPVAGYDIPPCLTLRDIGAPNTTVSAGTAWKFGLSLPLLMTRDGALLTASFPCEMTYVGRRVQSGVHSVVIGVRGTAPQQAPGVIEDMNRTGGTIRGALFYDAKTGLLVEAHVFCDVAAWMERGRIEDRVHVAGSMDVKRR